MLSLPNGVAFIWVFKAYLASDHLTPATGKTIPILISKNGGAFGNPSAGATNATEISLGWYYFTASTTDMGTNGIVALNGTLSSIDTVDDRVFVVNANNGGLAALPNTACTTNGSLLTAGTSTSQIDTDGSGRVNLGKALGTPVTLDANNVLNVSTKYVGGTLQTARDIGTSVLLSSGTGTGQVVLSLGTVTVGTNSDKTGYALTSGEHAALAADILDSADGIETGWTWRQAMRVMLAVLAGKSHGLDIGTPVYRNVTDTKDRYSGTSDAYGNRSATTYDVS